MSIDRPRIEMTDMLASIREAIEKETAGLRQAAATDDTRDADPVLAEDDLQFTDQAHEPTFLRRLPERDAPPAPLAGAAGSAEREARPRTASRPHLHAVGGAGGSAAMAVEASSSPAPEPARTQPEAAPELGPALERLAREMLKPMLREWLDDYLPGLVEEMVREEIVRILQKGLSGGTGGV